jgi:hypothetical protein
VNLAEAKKKMNWAERSAKRDFYLAQSGLAKCRFSGLSFSVKPKQVITVAYLDFATI